MDFDAAHRARDARLRWSILRLIDAARNLPAGVSGVQVRDLINGVRETDNFEDDGHAVRLLQDLANLQLVELTDTRTRRGEAYGLPFLQARITAKGTRFIHGGEPADVLVDDGRLVFGRDR